MGALNICAATGSTRSLLLLTHASGSLLFAGNSLSQAKREWAHGDYANAVVSVLESVLGLVGATRACFSGDTPLLTEQGRAPVLCRRTRLDDR
jgi:hypothetical protein